MINNINMLNLNLIAEQLFNSVKSRFSNLVIGDENGDITNTPKDARFFDFDFGVQNNTIGKVSVSLDEESGITIIYNKDMIDENYGVGKDSWFTFLKDMRQFSKKRLLKFEVRDVNRSNLQKRDYKFLANNRPGDNTMSESKMYGTHKTSFQKIGSAKLSIKHNASLGEDENRNKKIGVIFIENNQGEKFKYPYKHLSGARALAMHVSEGGNPYDDFGKYITGLSEELSKLRKFNQYLNRSTVMAETLQEYTGIVKDRTLSIKKEIQNLQKPNYYKETFENFSPADVKDVPVDVAENWIDQLTIKQFNEELKDVFPYIYNLIGETKPTEIMPEDIIGEELDDVCEDCGNPSYTTLDEEKKKGSHGKVCWKGYRRGKGNSCHKVNSSKSFDDELNKFFEEMMGQFSETLSEGYMKGYQNYHCKDCGCQMHVATPKCDCPHDCHDESGSWWRDKNGNGVPDIVEGVMTPGDSHYNKERAIELLKQKGITNPTYGELMAAIKQIEMGENTDEGNAYAYAVRKAKMSGAKKGDKIDHPDDDEEDIVIEKDKTPIGEYIMSHFDVQTGNFPKGETAVLTAIEKDYGEQYVKPASRFIERLGHAFETYKMRVNAGLEEGSFDDFGLKDLGRELDQDDDDEGGFKEPPMFDQLAKVIDSQNSPNPKKAVKTDDGKILPVSVQQARVLRMMATAQNVKPMVRNKFLKDIQTSMGLHDFLDIKDYHEMPKMFMTKYLG